MKKLNLHQYVWYFFIYSILGMFLEILFCLITSSHIESRKGFIIGPFCPIYGIGAILLTVSLEPYKKNRFTVFILGLIIGSIFEYLSSYVMQTLYGVKFWDYSRQLFNLNGRTSLMYSVCWGVLSIILVYFLNPHINGFIKLFEYKSLDIIIITYMCINATLTYGAIKSYVKRTEQILFNNTKIVKNENILTDKVMGVIFPNMKYVIDDNNTILITELQESKLKR